VLFLPKPRLKYRKLIRGEYKLGLIEEITMVTLFLATVLGWYLVIFSLFLILQVERANMVMSDVMSHRGVFFLMAVITLILGLLMVASHNIWVMGWPVVITIFSWLILIGGLVRVFYTDVSIKMGRSLLAYPNRVRIVGAVLLLVGLFLLLHVYYLR
jgi:hypothetical protein